MKQESEITFFVVDDEGIIADVSRDNQNAGFLRLFLCQSLRRAFKRREMKYQIGSSRM